MDGRLAIEWNRQALKRIVETLVDMAGLADGPEPRAEGEPRRTIPRILWRAILALLRPAESAARRLIIAASRGLAVPPPQPRKPKPKTMEPLLRRFGIAVVSSRFAEGKSVVPVARWKASERRDAASAAGTRPADPRVPSFPLFDSPRRLHLHGHRRQTVPPHAAPRIMVPGLTEPASLPPPPSVDDRVNAARLTRRLAALVAALDDLPGQARRFARWKASRDTKDTRDPASPRRISPIPMGRPPGRRLFRYDPNVAHPPNIREVDEILAHAHALAIHALESPDTS